MKEVKAYIRCSKAQDVLEALEKIGVTAVTLIDAMGVGSIVDPDQAKYAVKCNVKYSEFAKLELVCNDEKVHKIVETVRQAAYSGMPGDGIIFVSPVEMMIKIRTGAVGDAGL